MKTENKRGENKPDNVLSSYDKDNFLFLRLQYRRLFNRWGLDHLIKRMNTAINHGPKSASERALLNSAKLGNICKCIYTNTSHLEL